MDIGCPACPAPGAPAFGKRCQLPRLVTGPALRSHRHWAGLVSQQQLPAGDSFGASSLSFLAGVGDTHNHSRLCFSSAKFTLLRGSTSPVKNSPQSHTAVLAETPSRAGRGSCGRRRTRGARNRPEPIRPRGPPGGDLHSGAGLAPLVLAPESAFPSRIAFGGSPGSRRSGLSITTAP